MSRLLPSSLVSLLPIARALAGLALLGCSPGADGAPGGGGAGEAAGGAGSSAPGEAGAAGSDGATAGAVPTAGDGSAAAGAQPSAGAGGELVGEAGGPSAPLVWPGPRQATRIASNDKGVCVLAEDHRTRCWGGPARITADEFSQISGAGAVGSAMCGLRLDGGASCYGNSLELEQPVGVFKQVFASNRLGCAVDLKDRVSCWGPAEAPEALLPPEVPLTGVSVGAGMGCGFDPEGLIQCWGRDFEGSLVPDRTDYTALYIGGANCGIYGAGSVGCWTSLRTVPDVGDGFVQIAPAFNFQCLLHMDGHVRCVGKGPDDTWREDPDATTVPPETTFEEITVGEDWGCGVTTQREVKCWGTLGSPELDLPVVALDQAL